jgi:hypothetical protein
MQDIENIKCCPITICKVNSPDCHYDEYYIMDHRGNYLYIVDEAPGSHNLVFTTPIHGVTLFTFSIRSR